MRFKDVVENFKERINKVNTVEEKLEILSLLINKIWVKQDKSFWIEWK